MGEQQVMNGSRTASRRRVGWRALVTTVLCGLALAVTARPADADGVGFCTSSNGVVTCRFGYTGIPAKFTVPDGVTSVQVVAIGAPGGSIQRSVAGVISPTVTPGGRGARVTGNVAVTPGQVLTVTVGGTPWNDDFCRHAVTPNACGAGFNGGGQGATQGFGACINCSDDELVIYRLGGAGGGGATDLRVGPGTLADRVLVAGGGGGAGLQHCGEGGAGGDATVAGHNSSADPLCENTDRLGRGGGAGTQNAGGVGSNDGTLGQGGHSDGLGGAGGGGLYGGGSGFFTFNFGTENLPHPTGSGGGGGGSSLVPVGGTMGLDNTGEPGLVLSYVGPLPTLPEGECVTAGATVTCTFLPTASTKVFTVPAGVSTVHVVASGAPGGDGRIASDALFNVPATQTAPGGRGATVTADLSVSAGQQLFVTVGGASSIADCVAGVPCPGGYNGGASPGSFPIIVFFPGAPGGGASDLRVGGSALAHRVLVAGGGGGAGGSACAVGGAGGDADSAGLTPPDDCFGHQTGRGGGAGTQTAGGGAGLCPPGLCGGLFPNSSGRSGSLGLGGVATFGAGAGGGGLYGGGSGSGFFERNFTNIVSGDGGGGGGGSSLVPAGGTLGVDDARTPKIVISYAVPDTLAPTSSTNLMPAANAAGWNNTDVLATWNWADETNGSGINPALCTPTSTSSGEGANLLLSATCQDRAGNVGSASVTVKVDKTAPTLTCSATPTFLLRGPGGLVSASVTDGLSGAVAALVSAAADVSTVGTRTVSLTGTDVAGNTRTVACAYQVTYAFSGFLAPINNPPVVNTGRAGRTYPVKWQLRDATGAFVSDLGAVTSLTYQPTACGTFTGGGDPIEAESSGNSVLRYDATTNQFAYNWKTPSVPGCYTLTLALRSGQQLPVYFRLN